MRDENSVSPVPTFKERIGTPAEPGSFQRTVLVSAIKSMFGRVWSPVSSKFVEELLRQSIDDKTVRHHEKPKRLVCLRTKDTCSAAIVLLPKRGGAVKGLFLRTTNHEPSLVELCERAFKEVIELGGRKLYLLHPVVDSRAIIFLKSNGFRAEGLLRAPYVAGQDVIVMSRFI